MISYIKNSHCYLGGIIFRIDPSAYIREPDRFLDLPSLCPNAEPLNQPNNWWVEWGVDPLPEGMTLAEAALNYCDCDGEANATIRPTVADISCNNLVGYQLFWGDEHQQDMRLVFPHEAGYYFVHAVIKIPGTPGLEAIREVCQHDIVQTILKSIHCDKECEDITLRHIDHLDLPLRVYNALRRAKITTIEDVLRMDYDRLYRIPGLGVKGMAEVINKLESMGFDVCHMKSEKER